MCSTDENRPVTEELRKITLFLRQLSFKRNLIGGVDVVDVWKKIEKLNGLYEAALRAERIRYDVLLEEQHRRQSVDSEHQEGGE